MELITKEYLDQHYTLDRAAMEKYNVDDNILWYTLTGDFHLFWYKNQCHIEDAPWMKLRTVEDLELLNKLL